MNIVISIKDYFLNFYKKIDFIRFMKRVKVGGLKMRWDKGRVQDDMGEVGGGIRKEEGEGGSLRYYSLR